MFKYNFRIFLVCAAFCACGPAIHSFTANPLTVVSKDSVQLHWQVRGEPTLLFHEQVLAGDSAPHYLDFTLVVQKGGKEKSRTIQVVVLPPQSSDLIVFSTELQGDTLVASGIKNPERWGNRFEILSVANASGRPLSVTHSAITAELDQAAGATPVFAGTPVAGAWTLRSVLTAAEKADHSLAPQTLRIKINIQPINR